MNFDWLKYGSGISVVFAVIVTLIKVFYINPKQLKDNTKEIKATKSKVEENTEDIIEMKASIKFFGKEMISLKETIKEEHKQDREQYKLMMSMLLKKY